MRLAMGKGRVQCTLGELYSLEGRRLDPSEVIPDTRYIGLEHLTTDGVRPLSGTSASTVTSAVTPFLPGDVLFGRLRPYLRKVALVETEGVCSPEILVLRPNASVEPRFLHALASSGAVLGECVRRSAGSRMPRTSAADLASIIVEVPAREEQLRLIDLLQSVDRSARALEETTRAALEVREVVAAELIFGRNWPTATLADIQADRGLIGGPFGSSLTRRDYASEGIPVIRGGNLSTGSRFIGGDFVFVSADKALALRRNLAEPGDVIFTQRGTLGQVGLVPQGHFDRYVVSQSQMRLRTDPRRATAEYVYVAFSTRVMIDQIERRKIATANPHINLGILASMVLPVPPVDEQRSITYAVLALEDLATSAEQSRDRLESLRAAILDDVLSGAHEVPSSYDALLAETASA
jgi:restriction endonuclease S subunit